MSTSNDNAAAKFAVIKSKVLSYMDEMTKKDKVESTETATGQGTTNNQESTSSDDGTDNMKLQFTTLLNKVTSFVNKQEVKSENESGSTAAAQEGQGQKTSDTFSAEDLQAKLTTFVKSISPAKKSTSTETTTDSSTATATTTDSEKKDPVKDIMDQLKTAFPQFMKNEEAKDRSLGKIDESTGESKPNPVEEFFSFVQGILQKDNINKNVEGAKETMKSSAVSAQKSIDEGPEKNRILCGVF